VILGGCLVGTYYWARKAGWLTPVDRMKQSWDTGNNGIGIKNRIAYPVEPTSLTTSLPCVAESAMNSDIQSHFTAKVRNNIYDTATGRRLLVPQGTYILGEYQSASLVFGNERLPSMALTLALPSGSVDLGHAPVMNQEGIAGLVSRVNQHWRRNLGAVLIMGVLRGGQQAVMSEMVASGGGTGAMASGIASTTSQFGQQKLGRAIDTRPTIEVDAGTLCQVLLTKPLHLPVVAQR